MKICMLLHKSVEHDSRVRREARALQRAGHEVTVVHLPRVPGEFEGELDGFRVMSATPSGWVRRVLPFHLYRLVCLASFVRSVVRLRPDAVHAHDCAMLAPGFISSRLVRAQLIYDSHEYAVGVAWRTRAWARLVWVIERVVVPRCNGIITVSEGIADRLRQRYRLPERPAVVRNVPDMDAYAEGKAGLRARLGIESGAPLVLHQGALAPGRGCEALLEAVARLPGVHLVFLGDGWPGYVGTLRRLLASMGLIDRVHFVRSVPVRHLLAHTREADVGVSLLSDNCENHRLALPNKVFEYVAAEVPVVVSDLPELRAFVERYGVGWTTDASEPAALAKALTTALAAGKGRRDQLRRAGDDLRWPIEATSLLGLYERLQDNGWSRALVLVRNTVTYDARVQREARLLQELGYDTTVVGVVSTAEQRREATIRGIRVLRLAPGSPPAVLRRILGADCARKPGVARNGTGAPARENADPARFSSANSSARVRTLRRYLVTLDWYRHGTALVRRTRPALVHCNDYNTMWVGVAAKLVGARVIYDSHELWPDRNLRPEPRWWLMLCEAMFVRVADEVITTSPGYARVLGRRYRISPPAVVRNVPDLSPPTSHNGGDKPVAVYFGAITRHRGLEDAVAMLTHFPELTLRLIGPEAWGFRRELAELARRLDVVERVEFVSPVPPDRAVDLLSQGDVGLALIQPACLSYELTLPNKLFEYALAELPIIATRVPVIEEFIREWGLGELVTPGDQAELQARMRDLLNPEKNARYREAARAAARKLSWQSERELLAGAYRGCLPEPSNAPS